MFDRATPEELLDALEDALTELDSALIELHEARRTIIYERSGDISRDLLALRHTINTRRAAFGLTPSTVEPAWEDEESDLLT